MLSLVRPCSYALALGLGLVASEVCIPLNQRCLRAPHLYSVGPISLARPYQPCLWCGRHRVSKGIRPATVRPEAFFAVLCKALRLVRPHSYALAHGLGLVVSQVYIPLNYRCLRAPCLYSAGLVVLRYHTNRSCGVAATMYRREQGMRRFGQKLDSEDGGERSVRGLPEGTPETHLCVGKAQGYPQSYPTGSLALARGSNED